nr:MAG TPA: hypothetical protein [Caudoviricetes sp.]
MSKIIFHNTSFQTNYRLKKTKRQENNQKNIDNNMVKAYN